MYQQVCQTCGTAIKGRRDKKFCSQTCKNAWHQARRKDDRLVVTQVDAILHRNRNLLATLLGDSESKLMIPRLDLERMGFNFSYHTGTYRNSKNKTYYILYDHAWMEFGTGEILIVKRK